MATFSTNQVRQLYVVEALKDPNVGKNDAVGSVAVKSDSSKTHLYFDIISTILLLLSNLNALLSFEHLNGFLDIL